MAVKKTENSGIEQDFKTLSEEFADKNENFSNQNDDFDDDENAIEVKFNGDETELEPVETKVSEPVRDEFFEFIESLPENSEATIIVHRKPDHNLNFRIPCKHYGHIETIYWTGQTAPEIYDEIKKTHGGGRYQFQLRQGKGFGKTWETTILDPPFESQAEKTLNEKKAESDEQKRIRESAQVFANKPVLLNESEKKLSPVKELIRDFKELEDLRAVLAPPPATTVNSQMTLEDTLVLKMLEQSDSNPELKSKVIDYAFGFFDDKKKKDQPTFAGIVADVMKNPEQAKGILEVVAGVLPAVFSMFGGSTKTANPPLPASANLVNFPAANPPPQTTANSPLVNFPAQTKPLDEPETADEPAAENQVVPAAVVPAFEMIELK